MEKSNNIEKIHCYKHTCECNRSTSFRTYSKKYRGKRNKIKYKSDKHHALCTKCFYGQDDFVPSKRSKWSHKYRKQVKNTQSFMPVFAEDMFVKDLLIEDTLVENHLANHKREHRQSEVRLDAQYLDWSLYIPTEKLSRERVQDYKNENIRIIIESNSKSNNSLLLTNNIDSTLGFPDYQHTMNTFDQVFINEKGVHLFVQKFFEKFHAYIESTRQNTSYTQIHHFSTDLVYKLKTVFTCLLQHIIDRQHHQWYLPNEEQSPALVQYLSKAHEKTKSILLLIEALVPSPQIGYQAS